jgi:hypothetical protein
MALCSRFYSHNSTCFGRSLPIVRSCEHGDTGYNLTKPDISIIHPHNNFNTIPIQSKTLFTTMTCQITSLHIYIYMGPGSSVGIATEYGLEGPEIEFFAHVQTGPGTHPASCTMGTGFFPGVNRPGRGVDHPPSPSAEVENE